MIRHVTGFVSGFLIPWRGLGLIFSNVRIARFAALPVLITIVLFGAGLAFGLPLITGWVPAISTWLLSFLGVAVSSTGGSILSWIFPIALWPALALGLCFLIWMIARILVGPFFTLLAEAVLVTSGAIEKGPFNFIAWGVTNFRMLRVSILRSVIFGVVGLAFMVLSLIPVVGLFAGVAMLVILAFDLADYALEAYEWDFQQRVWFYRRHFSVFFGFALILGLVFLIPGLNFFLLPASVAGASDVVRRLVAADAKT